MPGFDGTGPGGMGPMTGGGRGWCAVPVSRGPVAYPPAVFGRGGGCGRGHRWMYYATGQPGWMRFGGFPAVAPVMPAVTTPAAEEELSALRAQAEWMRGRLDAIQARISELGKPE
ncbi:MAG: DUF5320 family protein [Armatimonadetes bacterium]|nr:DUF5320 family protein [Armatimonadota bacterium]